MRLTGAGARDRRIRFELGTETGEALGGSAITAWTLIEEAYASVRYGNSEERRQAGVDSASQVATFRVLSTTNLRDVTSRDRIVFEGGNWNITSGVTIGGPAAEIEFTAVLQKG